MHTTTHLETGNVTVKKCWIGQSAAKRLTIKCGMMKVQRLAERRSFQVKAKCGANMKQPIEKRFFEKVKAIRSKIGLHREIGAKYGVTPSLVSMICSGRIWRNV